MGKLRYVTVKQMRELEDAALTKHGIALSILMENAGKAVADQAAGLVKRARQLRSFAAMVIMAATAWLRQDI